MVYIYNYVQAFRHVLNFLRDGDLAVPRDPCVVDSLVAEARS